MSNYYVTKIEFTGKESVFSGLSNDDIDEIYTFIKAKIEKKQNNFDKIAFNFSVTEV